MFLNDDDNENASPWTYAFTTFLGSAMVLGWLGMMCSGKNFRTETWDKIDPRIQKQQHSLPPQAPPQRRGQSLRR